MDGWMVRRNETSTSVPSNLSSPPLSPLYSDHRLGTNPSSGVSLSQPPIMLSHRPKSMPLSEMERMSHHQQMVAGMSSEKSSQGRASSIKSVDSLDRRIDATGGLSMEEDFDLDPGEEEEGEGPPKVCAYGVTVVRIDPERAPTKVRYLL